MMEILSLEIWLNCDNTFAEESVISGFRSERNHLKSVEEKTTTGLSGTLSALVLLTCFNTSAYLLISSPSPVT